jgi:hypothetical protein
VSGATSWKLSTRVALWSLAAGTGFVVLLAITAYLFQKTGAMEELEADAQEELEEMRQLFLATPRTPQAFERCADSLEEQHSGNAMAWRVWERTSGALWASVVPRLLRAIRRARRRRPRAGPVLDHGSSPQSSPSGCSWTAPNSAGPAEFGWAALLIVWPQRDLVPRGRPGAASALPCTASPRSPERAGAVPAMDTAAPGRMRDIVAALGRIARVRSGSDAARILAAGLAHELRSPLQPADAGRDHALARARARGLPRHPANQIDELQGSSARGQPLTLARRPVAPANVRGLRPRLEEPTPAQRRKRAQRSGVRLRTISPS